MFSGFDTLLMFESPVQIAVVLLIALVVFGPQRLPELGKQLGSGLRELNKAKNDLMRSLNTDHEPDPEPYHYNYPTEQEANSSPDYYNTYPDYSAPPDLTDYTIAKPLGGHAPEGTVARNGHGGSNVMEGAITGPAHETPAHEPHESSPAASTTAAVDTKTEGESHV